MSPSFFRREKDGTKKSNIEKNADEFVNEKDTSRTFRLSGQQHSTYQNPADISVGTSNCRQQENYDEKVNTDIPMVLYRDAGPPTAVTAAHLNPSPIQTGEIRDGDATLGLSKYCIETDLSDCSTTEAESFRHQHSAVLKDSQMFTSQFLIQSSSEGDGTQPGSPVGNISPRLAFLKSHDAGRDPHIHIHVNGVHNSASANTFSSPVLSPRRLGHQEDQQQKKHWLLNPGTNHSQQVSSPNSCRESDSDSPSNSLPLSQRRQRSGSSPRVQTRGTATSTPLSPCSCDISPWSTCKAENGASAGNWQKGCLLGCGSFGKVYKGIHSKTGEFCAMKEVELIQDDPNSQESAKQIAQEIMLLSSLRHPNIVHYKGSEMICRNLYIYLELVSGGSIHKLCQEFTRLEEPIIRRYTRQILQGLCFLHSNHTVHRDIKGANILVDHDGTVKLADFGIAKHIKKQGSPLSLKGSPYWMAPEAVMQKNTGHEFAIDIWSLGCTVIEMFTGKPPFSEYEKVVAMFKVANSEIPPIPLSLSPEGHSFVRCCLQKDPAKRPSAALLLDHPFVQISDDGPQSVPHAFNIPDSLWLHAARGNEKFDNTGNSRSFTREGPQNTSTSEQRKLDGPAPSIYPSRSAPMSPRSLYHSHGGLIPTQITSVLPAFATNSRHAPQEGVLHTPSKHGCLHAARAGVLSMHPSRSAPVSPRTFYHSHGGLIPTQLRSFSSGLATNPRHAPQEGELHAQSQNVCLHAAGESARCVNCRSSRCFTRVASGNVSTRELGGAGNSRSFTRGPQNASTNKQRKTDGRALSIYPSRSAPVSPRSFYHSDGRGLIPTQSTSVLSGFATDPRHAPQEGVLRTESQHVYLHAAGDGALSIYPSRGAPVSPRSFCHSPGGLIPTQLTSILPGFATPPRHAPQKKVYHTQSQHACLHAAGEGARFVNTGSSRCFTQETHGNVSTRDGAAQSIFPSMSAPVSPRSFAHSQGGLVRIWTTSVSAGSATPPTRTSGILTPNNSDVNTRNTHVDNREAGRMHVTREIPPSFLRYNRWA